MSKALRILSVLVLLAAVAAPRLQAASRTPVWEVVEYQETEPESMQLSQDGPVRFDVSVHDGYIYITADRPVKVEVYTILGQIVTTRKMTAGTVRLSLGNKGIYIVKGADTTRRVNL